MDADAHVLLFVGGADRSVKSLSRGIKGTHGWFMKTPLVVAKNTPDSVPEHCLLPCTRLFAR